MAGGLRTKIKIQIIVFKVELVVTRNLLTGEKAKNLRKINLSDQGCKEKRTAGSGSMEEISEEES